MWIVAFVLVAFFILILFFRKAKTKSCKSSNCIHIDGLPLDTTLKEFDRILKLKKFKLLVKDNDFILYEGEIWKEPVFFSPIVKGTNVCGARLTFSLNMTKENSMKELAYYSKCLDMNFLDVETLSYDDKENNEFYVHKNSFLNNRINGWIEMTLRQSDKIDGWYEVRIDIYDVVSSINYGYLKSSVLETQKQEKTNEILY